MSFLNRKYSYKNDIEEIANLNKSNTVKNIQSNHKFPVTLNLPDGAVILAKSPRIR